MKPSVEMTRLSLVLLLRGAFLIPLAAIAVRWPEETLLRAMVAAGGVAGSLGIFEVAAAAASKELASTRTFMFGHGAMFVLFGILTASMPVASIQSATSLCALWLLAYATFVLTLAARMWYFRRARHALLAWSAVNLGFAFVAVAIPAESTTTLLYDGAGYTFALGVAQVVAGRWLTRAYRAPIGQRAMSAAPR